MTSRPALRAWAAVALLLASCDGGVSPPAAVDANAVQPAPTMAPAPGAAQIAFPELTGRVVDQAGILEPGQETRLSDRLADLESRTTDQLVVVTVDSLQGLGIGDFSQQLGRHWGIGQAERSNGVLLVVAPRERQVWIAVGYGLEPILTNARSSAIIERELLPAFRQSRWNDGISAGVDAIAETLVARSDAPERGQ